MILYQIQTKYRDEARPRSGVLRGREFQMKDSYSFDTTDEGLAQAYRLHREAYIRIFRRLGLDYRVVSAVSGAMGGSASEEFLAPAAAGEDTFVDCPACDYAANTEAVTFTAAVPAVDDPGPVEELDTPDTPPSRRSPRTCGVPASADLKNLLVKVDGEITAVGVPGDREVDLGKLARAPRARRRRAGHRRGLRRPPRPGPRLRRPAGPRRPLPRRPPDRPRHRLDHRRQQARTARRERGVRAGLQVDRYLDVVTVEPGDPCPRCGAGLALDRAIEIGHIFQLGRKYADAFQLDVLGQDGKPVRVTMGCYGIGVSRAVAALAEQTADEQGLCWPAASHPPTSTSSPRARAPQTDLAARGRRRAARRRACASCSTTGPRCRPGVKFTDAELIGVPLVLVAGRRAAEGVVELQGPPHRQPRGAPPGGGAGAAGGRCRAGRRGPVNLSGHSTG